MQTSVLRREAASAPEEHQRGHVSTCVHMCPHLPLPGAPTNTSSRMKRAGVDFRLPADTRKRTVEKLNFTMQVRQPVGHFHIIYIRHDQSVGARALDGLCW